MGTLVCAAIWCFYDKNPLLVIGIVLDLVSIVLAYAFGWHLLERFARKAADRYAESVLGSFLAGTEWEEG